VVSALDVADMDGFEDKYCRPARRDKAASVG